MRKVNTVFLKILFWCLMLKLIRKPAAMIDRFHQYIIGKLLLARIEAEEV